MKRYLCIILLLIVYLINLLNIGVVNATDNTIISSENWEEWQKEDYWEWHTRTTTDDNAYNGNHIAIENDMIDFYGYWQNSYKDFLYKKYEKPGKKIFEFVIDESKANYHTLDGAGFIFNANQENNKLSGYILLFRQSDVCVYRLDDVDIETFETASNTTIATYGELIESKPKTNSTIHELVVTVTPTNVLITEAQQEILNVDLDYTKHEGESFGLISSYVQHACNILSKIQFSQIKISLEDYNIEIQNLEKTTNNPIQGSKMELYNEKGEKLETLVTDSNGKVIFTGIKHGNYIYKQIQVSDEYILNTNEYTCSLDSNGVVKFNEDNKGIIYNEKKQIIKEEEKDTNKIEQTNTIIEQNKDNTIIKEIIPKAGDNVKNIFIVTCIIAIISIVLFIKIKNYDF